MNVNWWMLLLTPLLLGFQGGKTNFSGKWELDLKKSVNLPPSFRTVESYVAEIRHEGDSVTLNAAMGGNGQNVTFPVFSYALDGKEIYRADSLRGSFRWVTGRTSKDGKRILLDTKALLIRPDGAKVEFTQAEEWKISGTNSMEMAIRQKFPAGDSTRTERRIFRKVK